MKRALFLDVVIRERAPVLQLLAREDEALLVWRDTLLILNLRLHVVDRVRRFDLQRDRLARERLHEYLHPSAQTQHQVKRGLLLDVIVRKGTSIFELLPGEDQTLLIGRDSARAMSHEQCGLVEVPLTPPYLESWPSHCQSCQRTRPPA